MPALRSLSGPGLVLLLAGTVLTVARAADSKLLAVCNTVAGGEFSHLVLQGESLSSLGSRFGLDPGLLARQNNLKPNVRLKLGQTLQADNRHIVPAGQQDGIVINIPQRMLFFFREGKLVAHYPVGLGRRDWRTPTGHFRIEIKEVDPVWDVPPSIQEEMRREGKPVKTRVPACPQNPLGKHWMGLSLLGLGIHGTIAPSSIYRFRTHGCIRLHPDDAQDLFARVSVGDPVEILYEPVLLARTATGEAYVEVHPDVYKKKQQRLAVIRAAAAAPGLEASIDWGKVQDALRRQEGIARRVNFEATAPPQDKN